MFLVFRAVLLVFLAICWASPGLAMKDVQPTQERLEEWTQMLSESPQGLGPKITDRAKWEALAARPKYQNTVKEAEALLGRPLPELTDELYLDFSRTGNRSAYESVSDHRRERFGVLVLAECLENQGRFLPAIEETLRAICKEKTWVLPAHDRNLTNFQGKTTEIDLWSAMTSWSIATAQYWLGERLRPEVRKMLHDELERRTFAPFVAMVRGEMPRFWWLTTQNNWNAVCLSCVTGSALATIEDRGQRAFFAATAEKNIRNFLAGFTSDGYCSEGLAYWNYGFGYFVLLAETLRQASGNKVDLMADEHVRQIAQFGRRMEILPGIYPAFADCHFGSRPNPSLMAFLSARFGWEIEKKKWAEGDFLVGPTAWLYMIGMHDFLDYPVPKPSAEAARRPMRDWFPQGGVLICRASAEPGRAFGVALKGGHNAEFHNHNDVGSFVVALGHSQPLVDPGSEIYTARTFGPNRYESKVLNSFGHPVPVVAGQLQQLGLQAAGRVKKTEFTDEADTLVLDISSAYRVRELKKLERTFYFLRQGLGRLVVTDVVEFHSPQTFGNALITFSPWRQPGPSRLLVGAEPDCVTVDVQVRGGTLRIVAEQIRERLHNDLVPTRLAIEIVEPVTAAEITLTIEPKQ